MVRACVAAVSVLLGIGSAARAGEAEVPFRLERSSILQSPSDFYYFQSRGTAIPGEPPRIIVLTQATDRGGSHGYRDVFQIESTDRGRTWSPPARVDNLRRVKTAEGYDLVPGDLWPKWHAASGVVLTTGKTFGFRGGTKEDKTLERVAYAVYAPKSRSENRPGRRGQAHLAPKAPQNEPVPDGAPTGAWGALHTLDMPAADHAGRAIVAPNSGCCQRYDLPGGEILLPIRYCPDKVSRPYVTIVALCRFDGRSLSYVRHGSELTLPRGRGLYEPSVTAFAGRYYLTMRADDSAYVARSDDGLNYDAPVEWKFDDGKTLGSYNTQQHWVVHGDELYLCYTRRGAGNDHIFRHRAPLFMARVDPERLCVLRATEQVLMPQEAAALGNFGVLDAGPRETWVIDSEYLAGGARQSDRGRVLLTKILWP